MTKRVIQVFEHDKLTINEDEWGRSLSPSQLEALCQFNDKNYNKYFTVIRNGIKFSSYVGVIQIGRLVIEILPKADRKPITLSNLASETAQWRNVLLKMLSKCGYLKVETVSESKLKKRYNSLLDLYFEIYLNEVENLLHQGLIKKYRKVSGNVRSLKGQLLFAQNIQKNFIHKEQFFTKHQVYDYQHLINQILLKGLSILKIISYNSSLTDRINRILLQFPSMREIPITEKSFSQVVLNRKSLKYMDALSIAKMIILNYSPDIIKGTENMLALLFDMKDLWEKYIFKTLKKNENEEFEVVYQQTQKFWHNRHIKPDIIVHKNHTPFIIDTKWKIIQTDNPSDNDLKQMYVYNLYWDAPKSLLLYPGVDNGNINPFRPFHKGREGENACKTGFVNVLDENNRLNKNIATEIISMLE